MPMRFEIDGRTGSTAFEGSRWEKILNTRVPKLGNFDIFQYRRQSCNCNNQNVCSTCKLCV